MAAAQAHLKQDLAENTERDWPLPVLEMLSGRLTPQQLIAKVDSKDVGVREDHLSEAYYYIGKQYQFAQDALKAKDAFRKCLDQNVSMFIENSFALYELGQRKQLKKEGFFSGF
jgi:lipoprotein NlpI